MNKIIIANWKMNPQTGEEAVKLIQAADVSGLIVAPPLVYLPFLANAFENVSLAAQDVFWEAKGAFTGEVSVQQLKEFGVEYVIVGHSERRQNLGETDEMVAKKVKAVLDAGLVPVMCVGETKAEKDRGETEEVIKREILQGLSLVNHESGSKNRGIIIAYEPIWAIGTGNPDTPTNMVKMAKFIKNLPIIHDSKFQILVIYGGSVNSKNAADFFQYPEIEGALVGGASLKSEEIRKIVELGK